MDEIDKSSVEIRVLLRRLNPDNSNHKDRVRRLAKFRDYVNKVNTPEFYDDDIPLLFLGSKSDVGADSATKNFGLMEACGCDSSEKHKDELKRSAADAMKFLKYLVCDFTETHDGVKGSYEKYTRSFVDKNPFALAFCSLPVEQYKMMRFDLHLKETRGSAKEEACWVIVLLLTNHLSKAGDSEYPIKAEDFLGGESTVNLFESCKDGFIDDPKKLAIEKVDGSKIEEQMKANTMKAKREEAIRGRQEHFATKTLGRISEEFDSAHGDDGTHADDADTSNHDHLANDVDNSDDDFDDADVLGDFNRGKKAREKDHKGISKAGDINKHMGPAIRWEDSQLYREQKAKEQNAKEAFSSPAAKGEVHQTVRDSQEAMKVLVEREEEKAKSLGKDPLGIKAAVNVKTIQRTQAELMEQNLQGLDEATTISNVEANKSSLHLRIDTINSNAANYKETSEGDEFKKRQAQKESLMAIVESLGGMEALESQQFSVLFTDRSFDPMLFLSLVHMDVGYSKLIESIERLTDNLKHKEMQIQNLVREHFPLFVSCAEGIEAFHEKTAAEVGPGVNERITQLEDLAEKAAQKARKSFKPLLDNASEVGKVQSALAVLQRVAPILQAPFLMRQHVENRRYSQALKAYRRVLVIDENCSIELLNHVKFQAAKYLHETRRDLERSLTQDGEKASVQDLLNGIRDLSELLELDVPMDFDYMKKARKRKSNLKSNKKDGSDSDDDSDSDSDSDESVNSQEKGVYIIGTVTVNFRDYPPALACLMIQAALFNDAVKKAIAEADRACNSLSQGGKSSQINGDSRVTIQGNTAASNTGDKSKAGNGISSGTFSNSANDISSAIEKKNQGSNRGIHDANTQWKYDVLDARVFATQKAVDTARNWLPRLLRIGKAAREDEKRRAARVRQRPYKANASSNNISKNGQSYKTNRTAFDVLVSDITPIIKHLVEHAAFCGIGCPSRSGGAELSMTFGKEAQENLRGLLRAPLPPSQSTRVDAELAELVEILVASSVDANALRQDENSTTTDQVAPLDQCKKFAESTVVTIEKRRCIYAFEVCARVCSSRASGSGKFDADALLKCLQTLSEKLTRPEECTNEVESGCELVVRRCCEGLASYVRDRKVSARLSAVAECAEVMENIIGEVVREASCLTKNSDSTKEVMMDDIMGLEGAMFEEYLISIKENVANSVKVGWLDYESNETALATLQAKNGVDASTGGESNMATFPPYLSASLLSIVRCRAQVEQALGERIRQRDGVTYQHLSMTTVADGVVEGICHAVESRKMRLKVRQADRLANELQFLLNTLKKFLSDETTQLLESIRHTLCARAGRGGAIGDDLDGIAALEDLERLGRVYVLCLGE